MSRAIEYPKILSDLSSSYQTSALISSYFRNIEEPGLKVDYSDFRNHVWFSSAKNLYNIFLYKLYNFYDRTFNWDNYYSYCDQLSGFEKYSFDNFPSYRGYFFNSGTNANSYVRGIDYENKLSLTSSNKALSIEFCCSLSASDVPSENTNQYVVKRGIDDCFYEAYLSSSNEMIFRVQSGSSVFSASCPFSTSYNGVGHHFAFCWASASADTRVYVDSQLALATSSIPLENLIMTTGSIFIGCSSSDNINSAGCYITGSIDELRIWNSYRRADQIAEYYNKHIHWEPELIFYLKFNEPHYTMSDGAYYDVFSDYSKKPLYCQIQNYVSSSKQEGVLVDVTGSNLLIDNYYDPMIFDDHDDVITHINNIWSVAEEFDNSNRYTITDLIPRNYIEEELKNDTFNLTNLLYLFARQLDQMKLYIQHFGYLWKHNNDQYGVIPYNLLKEAIDLFGFEKFENFPLATIDELRKDYYVNETEILALKEVNEIFWRNLLANIIYIYKTKGTKESVKSFLHCLGIDENVVSLKNVSSQYTYPITASYINKHRYSKVLDFTTNTGSYVFLSASQLPHPLTGSLSVETLVSFKPYEYWESGSFFTKIVTSQPTVETGSIWGVMHSSSATISDSSEIGLWYMRDLTSSFGRICLVTKESAGTFVRIESPSVEIFDGNFYNVSYRRDSSYIFDHHYVDARRLNNGESETVLFMTATFPTAANNIGEYFTIGAFTGSIVMGEIDGTHVSDGKNITETIQTEVRIWDKCLTSASLDEHCKNYMSVGTENPAEDYYKLVAHFILDDGLTADMTGTLSPITNYSVYKTQLDAVGCGFSTSSNIDSHYELLEYNFLCPDLSLKYNTNKVRYVSELKEDKSTDDRNRVSIFSIEFNLADSLSEDIIKLFSDLCTFSKFIGVPIMKAHSVYDLRKYMSEVYFTRLDKNISFINYFNNLRWIESFYFNIIERLIPARMCFFGEEKVIESHMLERNKVLGIIPRPTSPMGSSRIVVTMPPIRRM